MEFNEELINRVSQLARLELTGDEKNEFSGQLSDILNYVEKIKELDTNIIPPTDHIVDLKNVFREDRAVETMDRKKIYSMAPEFRENCFVVPRIIEGND